MTTVTIPTQNTVDTLLVTTEAAPSGDSPIGKVFRYNPVTSQMELGHPKIVAGDGALDSSSGNITLVGNTWNLLASAPIAGGFRYGLTAYIPSGDWIIEGQLCIASAVQGVRYDVKVTQGRNLDPTYAGILSQNPVIVGGGCGTSLYIPPGFPSQWPMFSIPFRTSIIQNHCARGQAGEILVWVFPQCSDAVAGGAMNSVSASMAGGGIPAGQVSKLSAIRIDGYN